jgi:hypothetical protein
MTEGGLPVSRWEKFKIAAVTVLGLWLFVLAVLALAWAFHRG